MMLIVAPGFQRVLSPRCEAINSQNAIPPPHFCLEKSRAGPIWAGRYESEFKISKAYLVAYYKAQSAGQLAHLSRREAVLQRVLD